MANSYICRSGWIAFTVLLSIAVAAPAAVAASKKKSSANSSGTTDCSDPDAAPDFPWQQFTDHTTCIEFTNTFTFVYQKILQSRGSPPLPSRPGIASTNSPVVRSLTYEPTFNTTTPTALGDFATTFDVTIERSSDDTVISAQLSDATVSLAGVTVGYTDSVMNFWDGDFQSSAAVPSRTVGVARYEHEVFENAKLGISLETGVPTSRTSSKIFAPIYPDDPVLGGRFLYETDPLTVQVSAIYHRLKYGGGTGPLLPRLVRQTGSADSWAATAGATVALPFMSDDDAVSIQATYAVDASPYLGTSQDLSTLASVLPFKVDTKGWSAVTSYHHAWSDEWASNVFVSRLALDITTPIANPTVRTTRFAANVKWTPKSYFTVGAEIDYVDIHIEPNGVIGILSGSSGQQWTGYLFAELDF